MSLAVPWALVGLLLLPVLWWLHRQRRRPPERVVPSLLFLEPEPAGEPSLRRRLDPELLLAMAAALLLVLAAAGPLLERAPPVRVVRAVVSGGAPALARGYQERVQDVLARARASLGPAARLDVSWEPAPSALAPRPSEDALLAAALAAPASRRLVLSDREPGGPTAGVTWVAIGRPARNAGIVAASVVPGEEGPELFVNVCRHPDQLSVPALLVQVGDVQAGEAVRRVPLPAGERCSSVRVPLPADVEEVGLALAAESGAPWEDDLEADDVVRLERRRLVVVLDRALGPRHREVLARALTASLGAEGWTEAEPAAARGPPAGAGDPPQGAATLVVVVGAAVEGAAEGGADGGADPRSGTSARPEGPGWRLVLHPIGGGSSRALPPGADFLRADPLVADLTSAGTDLRVATGARPAPDEEALLWRMEGHPPSGATHPIVTRLGRLVRFLPDPVAGSPAPAETTLWPLFVDDLVRAVLGATDEGGLGFRARGLLDPDSTALGETNLLLDPAAIEGGEPVRAARTRELRPWLAAGALLCLLALWLGPALASPRRPARAPATATAAR